LLGFHCDLIGAPKRQTT